MQPHQQKFLEERYGFRLYLTGDDLGGAELEQAKVLVEAFVGRSIDFKTHEAFWNDDYIFVPYGWIGCSGYLVHRRKQHTIFLGTMLTPDEWVWAIYRGCEVDSWRAGRTSGDTLVISAIHNRKELLETFSWYLRFCPGFAARFDQRIRHLPWTIRNIALIYAIPGLMQAEQKGHFDFEINPPNA